MQDDLLQIFFKHISGDILAHAGTGIGHYQPVAGVHQQTVDKRPPAAHQRLDCMYFAESIPKYAVPVASLRQQGPAAGKGAIAGDKMTGLQADKTGDRLYILLGDVGAAISFAAVAAFEASEENRCRARLRGHVESPALFSM